MLASNYQGTQSAAKLDWAQAAGLGALIYTNMNVVASEPAIRSNRALMKSKVGAFSSLRGYTGISLLCKMSLKQNPEDYLDRVMFAYDNLRYGFYHSEFEAMAASSIADFAEPEQYAEIGRRTADILEVMKKKHPMLTGHEDVAVAALLAMSDFDVNEKLAEAEECYNTLKGDHFTFAKDSLQSVAMILAMSDRPVAEKCARFNEIRNAVNSTDIHMFAAQVPMLAALVDTDVPAQQIAIDINDASRYLKTKRGFGSVLGMGTRMRNVLASAIVLQSYQEMRRADAMTAAVSNAAASVIAQQIVAAIVMTIIMTSAIISASNSHS